MNKKGFTLVELLGVIVILSIIMLIAIPNITAIVERTKKDNYINDAKKMAYLVKYEIKKGQVDKPASGEALKITLKDLNTNEVEKDKDGLAYNLDESYVYVTRENGNITYYVQLIAEKSENRYRGILLTGLDDLNQDEKYEKYFENIDELEDLTPQELNENKLFTVGIAASNVEVSSKKISIRYDKSKNITVLPKEGYYLSKVECTNGYTTNAETGMNTTGVQTVTIYNNKSNKDSTCTFTGTKVSFYADIKTENTNVNKERVTLKYGGTTTLDVTPKEGYYLASASCSNGYTVSANEGIGAQNKQTIVISNNKVRDISECKLISYPAYPIVTGESNTWTTGTRTFEIVEPTPSEKVTRYEYYVSNDKTKPSEDVSVTGSFNSKNITVSNPGKYIFFRIIYQSGVISEWTSAKNLYIDSGIIAAPRVIGGGTEWAMLRTFMVISSDTTSGVSEYEYYVSESNEKPERSQRATASVVTPTMNVTSTGKYIFFRVINNARIMSEWTDAIDLYVDSNTYTITYNLNGGEQGDNAKTKYNVETEDFTLPTPIKDGYTFDGWYETSNFSGNKVTSISKGSRGNKVYYAKWITEEYSIIYNLYGGELGSGVKTSYTVETETFNLPTPTRQGYIFNGWFDMITGVEQTKIEKGTRGSKIFNAGWTPITYTIKFNANGGTGTMANQSLVYDISQELTANSFSRAGYIFLGWSTSANSTTVDHLERSQVLNLTTTNNGVVNLYAVWDRITSKMLDYSNSSYTTCTDVECAINELYDKFK